MTETQKYFPLSSPQMGIWYTEKFYPGTSIAGISATERLRAPVDFYLLEQAVNLLIENNDALRIRVCMAEGGPRQYVSDYTYRKLEVKDFAGTGENELKDWEEMMTRTPLFAEDADLFRFVLLKIDEETCGFYASLHHLISDAWSTVMVSDEIAHYYRALADGQQDRTPRPSYLAYLEEDAVYRESERFRKDAAYWQGQFETLPELVGIKARKSRDIGTAAARKSFSLPMKLCDKIREHIGVSGSSVFVTFISTFMIYLNRITGAEDAVIGVPVLGRHNVRTKKTLGMFVSTAPLRIHIDSEISYTEYVQELTRHWMGALRHQKYPIDEILRDVRSRFGDVERIYDIVFSYQNAKFADPDNSARIDTRWHFNGYQNEALAINFNEREDDGLIQIDYDYLTGVFHAKDIDWLHDHYIRMLWHALDTPSKLIKQIEMVSEKEKSRILNEFNHTDADFPGDRTMLDYFNERVRRSPDRPILYFGDESKTYAELDAMANAIAAALRKKGAGHGHFIAMMLRRSFEMMACIIAIWKTGGAYLPIDPDFPAERIEYMLQNGESPVLLATASTVRELDFAGEVLLVDQLVPGVGAGTGGVATEAAADTGDAAITGTDAALDEATPLRPDDVAYVIYTSGSTGQAKGVMVEHRALVNRINWMNRKYPQEGDYVILQKTTYTFDVSVWELVWWFFADVKMVFLAPEAEKYPDRIIETIEAHQVTTMHFVPSMLNAFLEFVAAHQASHRLTSLKQVFASGEALTPLQVNRFNTLINPVSGARLYNLYGPTEAAIDVSYYDCPTKPNQRVIPIGKPIDNIKLYIFDSHMNLQPIGIPGELCIAGVGLARGYVKKPELTAEKFVANPITPGERMYRTGDLARWFPRGDIEYLGRIDHQVKIRGFRIELGDIRHYLEQCPTVREAVVVCCDGAQGDKYLAAYYVAEEEIPAATIREFLEKHLPDYMVPSIFIRVERIPLLSNGKANASLLPPPDLSVSAGEHREIVAPRNRTEAFVLGVWSEILNVGELSVTDDFFKMGGDSITAINMVCRMPKPVNVGVLYEHPVLEDFVRFYDEEGDGRILALLAGEEGAGRNYILCPYGGGGAYSYLDFANALYARDPACCVYAANLPGHGFGAESGDFLPLHDAASLILKEAAERIKGKIIVYAHCVGTALGVELARLLALAGMDAEALFIGGILPSRGVGAYGRFFDPWKLTGDEKLKQFLGTIGLSAEGLNPKESERMLQAFRYDVRAYYRYFAQYPGRRDGKLSLPVYTVLGRLDRLTRRQEGKRSWMHISDGPSTVMVIEDANHYFTKTHAAQLAEMVARAVQAGAIQVGEIQAGGDQAGAAQAGMAQAGAIQAGVTQAGANPAGDAYV